MHHTIKVNSTFYEEEDFMKYCPNYKFIPTFLPAVKRIIAIGDVHGDIDLTIKSFKLAKLINDKLEWIAEPKDTVVVQLGDQIDSCRPIYGVYDCKNTKKRFDSRDDLNVLSFFNEMDQKARQHGGAVYSLFGNHELMNAEASFNYVSYKNLYDFKYVNDNKEYVGINGRTDAFKPGGPIANMLACTRMSVIIIGSNMFVHAGILPRLLKDLNFLNIDNKEKLKYINITVRKWLLNKLNENEDEIKRLLINNEDLSPFWVRILGKIPLNENMSFADCENNVKEILQVYQLGSIIIGHTPQLAINQSGINGTCSLQGKNKLYRVDGGFSKPFKIFGNYDIIQVLEILNDNEFNILTEKNITLKRDYDKLDFTDLQLTKLASYFAQNRII